MQVKINGRARGLLAVLAAAAVTLTCGVAVLAQNPANVPDGDWISLSGTVVATGASSFTLDYGKGVITVEMDDWDWYAEGRKLISDDDVTVYGRIDNDIYETRKIEASSVYVQDLGTHFYASSADEEDIALWSVSNPVVVGDLEISGKVASISGRELVLSSGLQVDTSGLSYNPLDDKGFQQIGVGDRIKVAGHIDDDIFERSELMARWIINLDRNGDKS